MPAVLDVVVIGGGQAGLSLGYFLEEQGASLLILEADEEVGESWRQRWDSLTLFTPSEYDRLSGLPLTAQTGIYPGKDEVADYLQRYARVFELPVHRQTDRHCAGGKSEKVLGQLEPATISREPLPQGPQDGAPTRRAATARALPAGRRPSP